MAEGPVVRRSMMVALVVVTLCLGACGGTSAARQVAEDYYRDLGANQMERVWRLYSDEFFRTYPKAAWQRQLRKLEENVGTYRSHRLISVRRGTTARHGDAFTVLAYEVRYSKLQTVETFTVGDRSGDRRPQILTHDVRYLPE